LDNILPRINLKKRDTDGLHLNKSPSQTSYLYSSNDLQMQSEFVIDAHAQLILAHAQSK